VLLQRALVRRLPEMHIAPLLPSVGKVVAGAAVMVGVVSGGLHGFGALGLSGRVADLVAVAGLIPLGVASYGAVLWILRIEGRDDLEAMLVRLPLLGRFFRPAL